MNKVVQHGNFHRLLQFVFTCIIALSFPFTKAQISEGQWKYTISGLSNFTGRSANVAYSPSSAKVVIAVGRDPVVVIGIDTATGNVVWKNVIDFNGYDFEQVSQIKIIGDIIFLVGYARWNSSDYDAFIVKMSANTGAILYTRIFGSTGSDYGTAIDAYSAFSPVIVVVTSDVSGSTRDYLVKFSYDLSTIFWANRYSYNGNNINIKDVLYYSSVTCRVVGSANSRGFFLSIEPFDGTANYGVEFYGIDDINSIDAISRNDSIYAGATINNYDAVLLLGWDGKIADNWILNNTSPLGGTKIRMVTPNTFVVAGRDNLRYGYRSGRYVYDYWKKSYVVTDAVKVGNKIIAVGESNTGSYFYLYSIKSVDGTIGGTGCTPSNLTTSTIYSITPNYVSVSSISESFSMYSHTLNNSYFLLLSTSLVCGPMPDLACNGVNINVNGAIVSGSTMITNLGTATASNVKVTFYASQNATITTFDCPIYSTTLSTISQGSTQTVTLPPTDLCINNCISPGNNYYIGVIVDPNDNIIESNENNNSCYNALSTVNPSQPTIAPTLSANAGCGTVSLSWTNVSSASFYKIYRNNQLIKDNYTNTFWTDSSGVGGSYYVVACNSCGCGPLSNNVNISPLNVPSIPSTVQTQPGCNEVLISWNNVAGATEYNVYADGNIVCGGVTTNSCTHSTSTCHNYTVEACNQCGCSSQSMSLQGCPGQSAQLNLSLSSTTLCIGQSVSANFTASGCSTCEIDWDGDGQVDWSGPCSSTPTHMYLTPGTYTVVAYCSGSCGNASDQVSVNVINPVVTIQGPTTMCPGECDILTVNVSGTSGCSCIWDDGTTGCIRTVCPTTTQTYTVNVDCGGCSTQSSHTIQVISSIQPVACFEVSRVSGCTVYFDASCSQNASLCEWDFGDGNIYAACGQVSHMYSSPDTYYVTLTVFNSCGSQQYSDQITKSVHVANCGNTTDIDDTRKIDNIAIYPSITNGPVFIYCGNQKCEGTILLYDINKQKVGEWKLERSYIYTINISTLPPAIYEIIIVDRDNNFIYTGKLCKVQ